jgi:Amt family ammonium transporter
MVMLSLLSLLLPLGFALVAIGGREPEEAKRTFSLFLLSLAIGTVGYFASGFALEFGGIGLVHRDIRGLSSLIWEWSPLDVRWGPGWGAIGLYGFFLRGEVLSPEALSLFLHGLPLVSLAVFITLANLWGKVNRFFLLIVGLILASFLHPVVGNWVWGGGWLGNLGKNAGLGHGFIDVLGASSPHLLGAFACFLGAITFGLRKKPSPAPTMPPVHLPILAGTGLVLALIGAAAFLASHPVYSVYPTISTAVGIVNILLAAMGGVLGASVYSLFVTGQSDFLMAVRGGMAGLVAGGASCFFIPFWAGLAIGFLAGLLLPPTVYLWEEILKLGDPSGVMAMSGLGSVLGILAPAFFANGQQGEGWNGVPGNYLGVSGQGVSGLLVSRGFIPDFPHQLYSQLTGILAVLVWTAAILVPLFLIAQKAVPALKRGQEHSEG